MEGHRRPGRRWRGAAAPLVWAHLHDYQRERILTFIDPTRDPLGAGYHSSQASIAIGSGGVVGKGWLNGTQTHLDFLPERHTDFIFAVFGEEFGLIGNALLLVLYLLLIGRAMVITANASTLFARLLAGAVTLMFFTYAFVNMGMVSGILPVVGVPLPLVSYGGTALVSLFIGLGILMSVQAHRKLVNDLAPRALPVAQCRSALALEHRPNDARIERDSAVFALRKHRRRQSVRGPARVPPLMMSLTISSALRSHGGSSASQVSSGVTRSPQRTRCEQQVSPPPNAGVSSSERGRTRPSSSASTSATGTVAADMLPYRCTVTNTRSIGHAGALRDRLDDAQVRLVRDHEVDVAAVDLPRGQRVGRRLATCR